jgi:hypothetical protein
MLNITQNELEVVTSNNHRGIIFLLVNDKRVTIRDSFASLNKNIERHFRSRFDAWRDGINKHEWYHGWDSSEFGGKYIRCFVFKCKEKHSHHRLYGFLCNPDILNRRFLVCILVNHAKKNKHQTDVTFLDDIEEIRTVFINDSNLRVVCESINIFLGRN